MTYLRITAHLFTWSFIWGGTGYYSYVISPISFKTLPRREFGALQSKVFTHYFWGQSIAPIIIGLSAPYVLSFNALGILGIAIFSGLANTIWLSPLAMNVREKRYALEDQGFVNSSQHQELTKQFGKLHGLSLLFNMVNFAALTTYGFVLTKNILRYAPK